MNGFTAAILHRDDYLRKWPMAGLTLTPRGQISTTWHGGYKSATIDVTGDDTDLLRLFDVLSCGVRIFNPDGVEVWFGMVWGATINIGVRKWDISLDDVYNRVQASYVALSDEGTMETYTSDWAEDENAQVMYGVREVKRNMSGEANSALAAQYAATDLELSKLPRAPRQRGDGGMWGQLQCVGLIKEIDNQYYENTPGGRTSYEANTGVDHVFGWEQTDDSAGFSAYGDGVGAYSSWDGKLPPQAVNGQFNVQGTAYSNNNTYTITERVEEETQTYNTNDDGAGWRWDAGGTYLVEKATTGLGFVGLGQQINIQIDNATNDSYIGFQSGENGYSYIPEWTFEGYFNVSATGSERVKCVYDATRSADPLDEEYTGSSQGFDQGGVSTHPHYLDGTLTTAPFIRISPKPNAEELRNAATTYTVRTIGERIDQMIDIPVGGGGYLWKVAIKLAKVGTPSDTVRVSVWNDNGAKTGFGSMIDEGWISESEVGTGKAEVWCEMDNAGTNTISDSTTYHIVIERTGAFDPDNYWILDIVEHDDDGDENYTYAARFYDGADWVQRPTAAYVPFRVWTGVDLAEQIANVIDDLKVNLTAAEVQDTASLLVSPYAEGDRRGLDVIQSLLESGYSGGAGMVLEVTSEARAVIRQQGSSSQTGMRIRIAPDGYIETRQGGRVSPGTLYVGEWAEDAGAPPPTASVASMSPMLIAEMSYNIDNDMYDPQPPGVRNPFDMGLDNA